MRHSLKWIITYAAPTIVAITMWETQLCLEKDDNEKFQNTGAEKG